MEHQSCRVQHTERGRRERPQGFYTTHYCEDNILWFYWWTVSWPRLANLTVIAVVQEIVSIILIDVLFHLVLRNLMKTITEPCLSGGLSCTQVLSHAVYDIWKVT